MLPKNYGAVKFELNLENQRMTIMGVQAPNTIGSCFLHLIFTFNFTFNFYIKFTYFIYHLIFTFNVDI